MPTALRGFGSFATIGSAIYFSGGGVSPQSSTSSSFLEVYYGPPVAATYAPTPSPTTAAPTPAPTMVVEPWTTRMPMPYGCEDVAQSCAVAGAFLYQNAGSPPVNDGDWMKYASATDAWSIGNARIAFGPQALAAHACCE
jgi:hypothetical protein